MSLLRGPAWQYVVTLYNAKNVNPLAGWPNRFAAWVVDALIALHNAIAQKQADEARKAIERAHKRR